MRNVLFSLLGLALVAFAAAPAAQQRGMQPVAAQDTGALRGPSGMSASRVQAVMQAASRRLDYLPGEVVVKFRDGISADRRDRAMARARTRLRLRSNLEWINGIAVLHDASGTDPRVLAAELEQQDDVEYAEPNYWYKLTPRSKRRWASLTERDLLLQPRATTPNDPGFSARQWNFAQLDMPRAWDIAPGGSSSIIVAVVDTGITTVNGTFTFKNWNGTAIVDQSFAYAVNPDMSAARFVAPFDFINNSTTVLDMEGHGTHVASTVGEDANNGLGDAGMAYNVRIMPVKVCLGYWDAQFARSNAGIPGPADEDEAGCPNSAIAAGIRYAADNGAKVINLSLGGDQSTAITNAIQYAISKGAFVAAAAGNEFEDGNPTEYPAGDAPSIDGLMSVAATNRSGNRAYYSNTGSHIEIAAPGGDDRDAALGTPWIWQSTLLYSDQDPAFVGTHPRFDRYSEIGYEGTSMATPHVSGTAALLMSRGVTNPAAIEAILKRTAKDLGAPGKDDSFGYGLLQPRTALFGYGAIK